MSRAQIIITSEERRTEAAKWISAAPAGTRIEFKAPKRSLPQNDRMWAMLSDVSTQLIWHGQHLTANDWKLVFLDALDKEVRTCPDIYGIGRVNLGRSSSDLSKEEMTQLMELMMAFGTEHGVKFHDDPTDHLLASPVNAKRLRESIQDLDEGRGVEYDPTIPTPKLSRAEVMAKARAAKAAKATEKPAGKPSKAKVVDTALPPETAPEAPKAQPKPPATTEGYIAYAQGQILANKGKVSPSLMETWFESEHEARLRQDCKVGTLATNLLRSLIKGSVGP